MANVDITSERARHVSGGLRIVMGRYVGPTSYVLGGDPLSASDVGLGEIEHLDFEVASDAVPVARALGYNRTTGKVVWFLPAGGEVTAGTNLSTFAARFMAHGK
jgi:hypothetical protein